ncbi:MAG TPA: exodeoxyribonuclease VII small subunit [Candidatus Dormibacteraeota bacterium]|jgi:exodeoxyribonuclease VII small subunit
MTEAQEPIEKLTYEGALGELETLIRRLETGSIDLADSIASYERGVALAAHCSGLLEATEKKVQRLVLGGRGEAVEVPVEGEDEA